MRMPSKGEVLGVAVGLSLSGAAGCGDSHPVKAQKAECGPLQSFSLIGVAPGGGENAANTGECAAIYDPATLKTIGSIGTGPDGAFLILCSADNPTSLEVKVGDIQGKVNLGKAVIRRFSQGIDSAIPECRPV